MTRTAPLKQRPQTLHKGSRLLLGGRVVEFDAHDKFNPFFHHRRTHIKPPQDQNKHIFWNTRRVILTDLFAFPRFVVRVFTFFYHLTPPPYRRSPTPCYSPLSPFFLFFSFSSIIRSCTIMSVAAAGSAPESIVVVTWLRPSPTSSHSALRTLSNHHHHHTRHRPTGLMAWKAES